MLTRLHFRVLAVLGGVLQQIVLCWQGGLGVGEYLRGRGGARILHAVLYGTEPAQPGGGTGKTTHQCFRRMHNHWGL